jgi:hypothetical protein
VCRLTPSAVSGAGRGHTLISAPCHDLAEAPCGNWYCAASEWDRC